MRQFLQTLIAQYPTLSPCKRCNLARPFRSASLPARRSANSSILIRRRWAGGSRLSSPCLNHGASPRCREDRIKHPLRPGPSAEESQQGYEQGQLGEPDAHNPADGGELGALGVDLGIAGLELGLEPGDKVGCGHVPDLLNEKTGVAGVHANLHQQLEQALGVRLRRRRIGHHGLTAQGTPGSQGLLQFEGRISPARAPGAARLCRVQA